MARSAFLLLLPLLFPSPSPSIPFRIATLHGDRIANSNAETMPLGIRLFILNELWNRILWVALMRSTE
jgi:hypothetical protein